MKHQVALNAYELDVFSIAGLGGLCPPAKNWGVWGAAPPSQKYFENFAKNFKNAYFFYFLEG